MLSGSLEDRRNFSLAVNGLLASKFDGYVAAAGGAPRGARYAVLTCGSVGRLEMAPFSDIDYMIVVSDASDDVREFFLGVALHMRCLFASTDRRCSQKPSDCGPRGYGIPMCEFMVPEVSPELIGTPDQLAGLQLDGGVVEHIKNAMLDVRFASGETALFDSFMRRWFEVARRAGAGSGPGATLALQGLEAYPDLSIGEDLDTKSFMKAVGLPVIYICSYLQLQEQSLPEPLPLHISDRLEWLAARGALPMNMTEALLDAYEFFFALRVQVQNSRRWDSNRIEVAALEQSAQEQLLPLARFVDCFDSEAFAFQSWARAAGAGPSPLSSKCLHELQGIRVSRAPVVAERRPLQQRQWTGERFTLVNPLVDARGR